jgi:hypothetical protein
LFVALMYLVRIWLLEDRLALLIRPRRGVFRTIDSLLGAVVEILAIAWIVGTFYIVVRFRPPPINVVIVNSSLHLGTVLTSLFGGEPTFLSVFVRLIGDLEQSAGGSLAIRCLHDTTPTGDPGLPVVAFIVSMVFAPAAAAIPFDPMLYCERFFSVACRSRQEQCQECMGRGIYTITRPLVVGLACFACRGSGRSTQPGRRFPYDQAPKDHHPRSQYRESWFNLPLNPTALMLRDIIRAGWISCVAIMIVALLLHLAMAL